MKYDLICLGELLIDFVQEKEEHLTQLYQANAGGAPGNVACAAQQFGLETAFIGAVGKDAFGRLLIQALEHFSVDTRGIDVLENIMTTLAFVSLDEDGNREFTFARKGSADTMLELGETQMKQLEDTMALHFGTLSLTDEPSRSATFEAVKRVQNQAGIISFDPNVRLNLWDDVESLRNAFKEGLAYSNILKISDEDLAFLLNDELKDGILSDEKIATLFAGPLQLLLLTLGKDGAKAYWMKDGKGLVAASAPTDLTRVPIDTTGAGDIFTGAFLSQLLPKVKCNLTKSEMKSTEALAQVLNDLDPSEMQKMLRFANEIASLSTEKHGGITSIPDQETWEENYG